MYSGHSVHIPWELFLSNCASCSIRPQTNYSNVKSANFFSANAPASILSLTAAKLNLISS